MLLSRYSTNTTISTPPSYSSAFSAHFPLHFPKPSPPHPSLPHKRLRVCSGMEGLGVSPLKDVADAFMEEEYVSQSKLYKEFTNMPTIDKAWTFKSSNGRGSNTMFSVSQPNLLSNKKKKLMLSSVISEDSNGVLSVDWSPFPIEVTGASLMVPSPSGSKLLVVRNPENDSPIQFEIWGSFQLEKEIRVPQSVHGSVYADGWFEGVSWSSDESLIAYVAEEPTARKPTFNDFGYKKDTNSTDKDCNSWKGHGEWEEDWGEAYSGKRQPALFVVNINSGDVRAVNGIGRSLSVGQVVWGPTKKGLNEYLVFVGWPSDNRKFGMKYCFNRPCALYAVKAPSFGTEIGGNSIDNDGPVINVSKGTSSAFLPRFTPDGKFLVFLSAKTCVDTGAHSATHSLHKTEWNSDGEPTPAKIIDVVPVVMCPEDGCFPGMYCFDVLSKPWLSDGSTMILTSIWGSTEVIVSVNLLSGKVTKITPSNSNHSWSLLALDGNNILAVCSSLVDVPQIKYGSLTKEESKDAVWHWLDVSSPTSESQEKVKSLLSSLQLNILKIPVKNVSENPTKGAGKPIEAIYVSSKLKKEDCDPMIVILHGGPHGVSLSSFSKTSGFLASLGYSLLIVNYRGSIGFGEEALQSILGKIGSQDVNDVLTAVDYALQMGLANPSKITVLGGSHGGFLTTHLIGQAPNKFVAAAVRNPVCNLGLMVGTSDIPDWCFVETFGTLGLSSYTEAPTPQLLSIFHEKSPISHLPKVKTPTLFLLGAKDLRVPVTNGLQFARALKEKGVPVKVIVFPEDIHPINRPQSDFESFVNIGVWFKKYCKLAQNNVSSNLQQQFLQYQQQFLLYQQPELLQTPEPQQPPAPQPQTGPSCSKKGKKVCNKIAWSRDDEILLTTSWISVSEEERVGTGSTQKGKSFWYRVQEIYNKEHSIQRTKDQLTSKWRDVNIKVSNFNDIFTGLVRHQSSGQSEANILTLAIDTYLLSNGSSFPYMHIWELLKDKPIWACPQLVASKPRHKKQRTFESPLDAIPQIHLEDVDDYDPFNDEEEPQRPPGKPRKGIRSSSMSLTEGGSSSDQAFKNEVLKNIPKQNSISEDYISSKKMMKELQFLSYDTSNLNDVDRELVEKKKNEIRRKYV